MDISVKNYQSIIDVTINVEGLTIIKGQSNAGKSSLFKALYSATHNRFRNGCVRFGQDSCVVSVRYPESPIILRVERAATGGSPQVRLGCKALGYKTFNKMNRDLPPEIQQFNNFGKIAASTSDEFSLNFTPQFTPPLLVQFSPKKVVEILAYSQATQDSLKAKKQIDEKNLKLKGAIENMDTVVSHSKDELAKAQRKFALFKDRDSVLKEKNHYQELSQALQDYLDLQFVLMSQGELEAKTVILNNLLEQSAVVEAKRQELNEFVALKNYLDSIESLETKTAQLNELTKCVNEVDLNAQKRTYAFIALQVLQVQSQQEKVAIIIRDNYLNESQRSQILLLTTLLELKGLTEKEVLLNSITSTAKAISANNDNITTLNSLLTLRVAVDDVDNRIKEYQQMRDESICPYCGNHFIE